MKTTLNISDATMRQLKREAARKRKTMSELVEAALRVMVEPRQPAVKLPPLPSFLGDVNSARRTLLKGE